MRLSAWNGYDEARIAERRFFELHAPAGALEHQAHDRETDPEPSAGVAARSPA